MFKAYRLFNYSTLGSRATTKREEDFRSRPEVRGFYDSGLEVLYPERRQWGTPVKKAKPKDESSLSRSKEKCGVGGWS